MADIKVQRGTYNIGNTTETDTTFDAVSSLTAAFEKNQCNQRTTPGDTIRLYGDASRRQPTAPPTTTTTGNITLRFGQITGLKR